MKITFLGTGAAEGIPAVFSRTKFSQQVRSTGGPDLRTRSSLRIGDHHQIDFSPDNFWQMHRCGFDMYDIEHILVSHSHEDHFQYDQIIAKEMPDGTNGKPLNIHLSAPAADWLERVIECRGMFTDVDATARGEFRSRYPVHRIAYGETYDFGGISGTALPGNHRVAATGERAINYLLDLEDDTTLLYALDTGYYLDDTWELLQDKRADIVIMDCTFGGRTDRGEFPSGHLDCRSFVRMLDRMSALSCIDKQTRIFATHINPDQGLDHEGLVAFFDQTEYSVTVAYDGLSFETAQ